MTLRSLSFTRQILPALALAGLLVGGVLIYLGLPERSLTQAEELPARPTGALIHGARVAGAGIVEPSSETIDIGTALSGLVTTVAVTPGEYVTRGQPLFSVDQRAARARLSETGAAEAEAASAAAEAQAAIAEARAAEQTAARQLALYRQISDPAAVSRAEIVRAEGEAQTARERRRLAEARLAAARARISSARAAGASVRTELARLTVTAPISGQILAVNIRPGEFVSAGGPQGGAAVPYIQMGETRPLHVRIDVDEDEAVRLAAGQPAQISVRGAAGQQVTAQFVRIEPQIVPKRSLTNSAAERVDVRVMQIIYRLPASDLFRVGQQVDAFMPARPQAASQTVRREPAP